MTYKDQLEAAIAAANFKISDCHGLRSALSGTGRDAYDSIESKVDSRQMKHIHDSTVRNAFLIELVNHEITSTKFQTRWFEELLGDPRYADFNECLQIAEKILVQIDSLGAGDLLLLASLRDYKMVPYELPIDYIDRYAARLHSLENTELFFNETVKKAISLRALVLNPAKNPSSDVFDKILKDKIKVKTYLTDRAQTGLYQTNREKRWETHPNSVQYALRRDCIAIETELLLQIARFEDSDAKLVAALIADGYLNDGFDHARCPITGEVLNYHDFANDVLAAVHGKSKFQVGHLNPLKTFSGGTQFGHSANNISWISDDGNRIQGSLSMDEVDELLVRTFINRNFEEKVEYYLIHGTLNS